MHTVTFLYDTRLPHALSTRKLSFGTVKNGSDGSFGAMMVLEVLAPTMVQEVLALLQ